MIGLRRMVNQEKNKSSSLIPFLQISKRLNHALLSKFCIVLLSEAKQLQHICSSSIKDASLRSAGQFNGGFRSPSLFFVDPLSQMGLQFECMSPPIVLSGSS